jgi:hypothetical protein
MAAVLTTATPVYTNPGFTARPRVQTHRASSATYRRRRLVALLIGVMVVLAAGRAGAALGGSTLATPERRPSVIHYVVQPGDSLWSVAQRLAPDEDPRAVVDELATVYRGDLIPGEEITWQP